MTPDFRAASPAPSIPSIEPRPGPSREPGDVVHDQILPRLRVLRAGWRRIALAAAAGGALAAGAFLALPKSYLSYGMYVLMTPSKASLPNMGALGSLAASLQLGDMGGMGLNTLAAIGQSDNALSVLVERMDERARRDAALAEPWFDLAGRPEERTPKQAERLLFRLARMTTVSVDGRGGTIALGAEAPTGALALAMAETYASVLDSLSVGVLSAQARLSREEAERQAAEAEREMRAAEDTLRAFLLRNRSYQAPSLQFEARRLEREASLRSSMYSQIAARLAEARLEEKATTPVLISISPPRLPIRQNGPGLRAMIALGLIFGAGAMALVLLWGARAPAPRAG